MKSYFGRSLIVFAILTLLVSFFPAANPVHAATASDDFVIVVSAGTGIFQT